MHTSLIFKYSYLNSESMYYIQYLYQYSDRLQFEVTITSTSATSFRIHDFNRREHPVTYIDCTTIRPKLRTLYSILSPVLLSFDAGGVPDYPVGVQINPSGSGDSAVPTS